jgi:tRNA modification GTPase
MCMSPGRPSTIYALSSAAGRAGVAVLRISGDGCADILSGMAGALPEPRRATLRRLRHPLTRDPLDTGLVLWMPAPASFTGEDCAELHIHGGRAVIRAAFAALATFSDARMAEPGEFTRRAFLNGRIDLTAAEGLADLIDAETEAQRRQALRQASAGLAATYDGWRERILTARGLMEAAIDFSDEGDVSQRATDDARQIIGSLRSDIEHHLAQGRRGEILRDGFRVVIAGPPNVGKSSLLNALAKRDVAIVSDEAGTTRDALEVRLDLGGWPVLLTDTAGVRHAIGAVEQEGIRRAKAYAAEADLVIWLIDAVDPDPELPPEFSVLGDRLWRVVSKADLQAGPASDDRALRISARTGDGLERLTAALTALVQDRLGNLADPVATQARHRQHVERCYQHILFYTNGPAGDLELRAEDLRLAADSLGRITGRVDPEQVLDAIFRRFCIGK